MTLRRASKGYVLGVTGQHQFWSWGVRDPVAGTAEDIATALAPADWVRLSAGAGFVVVITGEIMTMPGLPKSPSAERIFLNDQGYIEGLF